MKNITTLICIMMILKDKLDKLFFEKNMHFENFYYDKAEIIHKDTWNTHIAVYKMHYKSKVYHGSKQVICCWLFYKDAMFEFENRRYNELCKKFKEDCFSGKVEDKHFII